MMLKTTTGTEFEVHLDGPETATRGILMIHDWWGVLDYHHAWARRFAELGYRVALVDLYDGERARTTEEAGEMMRAIDQDETDAKLLAALDYLKEQVGSVATLGWSLGGRQAMQAALLDPESVGAVVLFYCRMVTDVDQLSQLAAPVLAIYAQNEHTWPSKMERFAAAMEEAGKHVESHSFEAGHGFINPGSERYNADFAEESWTLVSAFLERALSG